MGFRLRVACPTSTQVRVRVGVRLRLRVACPTSTLVRVTVRVS